jgi:3-oxoacyl-[acyl-carrier protein] reductase
VSGRVALVSGATRGIGRAIAERLIREGRSVVAVARDGAALAALAEQHPGRVSALAVDLAEPGAAEWAMDEALRIAGRLDELVCAAGIVRYAALGKVSRDDLAAQLEVNLVAPYMMAQRAAVHMRERGAGALLFISSTLGTKPAHDTSAYAASKAGVLAITRSFALEFAPQVRVNALAPGVIDTDMIRVPRTAKPGEPQFLEEKLEDLRALHLLGRLGSVDDVAQAALYLLDASWVTGTVLTIDGGLSVR